MCKKTTSSIHIKDSNKNYTFNYTFNKSIIDTIIDFKNHSPRLFSLVLAAYLLF